MSQERREQSAMPNAAQRSSEMVASSQSPVALAVAGSILGVAMVRSAMVRRTEEQSRESPAGRGPTGNRLANRWTVPASAEHLLGASHQAASLTHYPDRM